MSDPNDIFDEMERLINITLSHKAYVNVTSGHWRPSVDIYETGESIVILVELAGMRKEEIELTYDNGYLFVSGLRKQVCPEGLTRVHRMEIDAGKFLRKIWIGRDIVIEDIEAEYREGILRVTIPKKV